MYKILALAVAVVVMPISEKMPGVDFSVNKSIEDPVCLLSFKNTGQQTYSNRKKNCWICNWDQSCSCSYG